ncbi:MAG: hypothetical protein CR972_03660 [Candidatus Moraniibacteriota bacterium]|nr:MAG: hypothetical protein CR972_03660 [Candidatus Moranbacteria bacterium]
MIFNTLRRIKGAIKGNRIFLWTFYTSIAFLIWFILLAVVHRFCEQSDWITSFWMAWETMTTVGYGDAPAVTTAGRISTMLFGSVGIVIMSALFGTIVVLVESYDERRRKGMNRNPYKDCTIIIHFPGTQRLSAYVKETRETRPDTKVCIVDNSIEELPIEIQNLGGIHFVKGSMLDQNTHFMSRIHEASTVIIFPPKTNSIDADAMTSTLVKLVEEEVYESVRLIHVVSDKSNMRLFKGSRSVPILEHLEVLSIVQENQDPHSAPIVEKLLRNSDGGNPKSVKVKKCFGITWHELQIRFAHATSRLGVQANLLALVSDNEIYLCPDADYILAFGDELSIIAKNDFAWPPVEDAMCAEIFE